jgi:hypothetical protein
VTAQVITLGEVDNVHLKDRLLRHSWDDHPDPHWSPFLFRTATGALALRCTRCGKERYDYFGKGMELTSRRYITPTDYPRMSREDSRPFSLRAELLSRSFLVQRYQQRSRRRTA